MRLPESLSQGIEEELSAISVAEIARASIKLSDSYKSADYSRAPLDSPAARLAYLQVRMPATFAANAHVFRQIANSCEIGSMLDLGAGPGTSMWAAAEAFPSIKQFTLIERDRELQELGRRLAWHSQNDAVRGGRWGNGDIMTLTDVAPHDLVILSYVSGELPSSLADQVLRSAWAKASKLLVIIEPGTPRHFAHILSARDMILQAGGHPVAPCPHCAKCPMVAAGDWCHFSERLHRTAEHRRLKSGTLGYEDEKFSYFVASKTEIVIPESRIIRHPMKHKGHVQLTLCTDHGVQHQTVSKSQKDIYRAVRDSAWGDTWNHVS